MLKLSVKKLSGLRKITGLTVAKKAFPVFLRTRFGIHTFGMKFPIDVLILNKDQIVVKVAENLKPNQIFIWNPIYEIVIELPAGDIKKFKIEQGQKIKLKFS